MVVGGLGRSRWWPKTLVTQSHVIDVKSGEGSCEGSLFCFGGWLILMFCLRSECCCCFRFLWDLRCCNFGGGGQLREQLFFFVGESVRVVSFDCYGWLLPGLGTAMVMVCLCIDWVCWASFRLICSWFWFILVWVGLLVLVTDRKTDRWMDSILTTPPNWGVAPPCHPRVGGVGAETRHGSPWWCWGYCGGLVWIGWLAGDIVWCCWLVWWWFGGESLWLLL